MAMLSDSNEVTDKAVQTGDGEDLVQISVSLPEVKNKIVSLSEVAN